MGWQIGAQKGFQMECYMRSYMRSYMRCVLREKRTKKWLCLIFIDIISECQPSAETEMLMYPVQCLSAFLYRCGVSKVVSSSRLNDSLHIWFWHRFFESKYTEYWYIISVDIKSTSYKFQALNIMLVTIKVAKHDVSLFNFSFQIVESSEKFFQGSCFGEYNDCHKIIQSSFDRNSDNAIRSSSNDFVRAAVEAYSYHQHLLIRPEDVWFAILTQLSVYINKHAEELREKFVAHSGKIELEVVRGGTRYTVDHNSMIEEIA